METKTETIFSPELFSEFNWFESNFVPELKSGIDLFYENGFEFKLLSASKNINPLFKDDSYFVTKIQIDKTREMHIRCSEGSVKLILDKIFGKNNGKFNFNKITDLEAKLITSLNDCLYNNISKFITNTQPVKQKNADILHLTFYVRNSEKNCSGKVIFSLPSDIIIPKKVISEFPKFDREDFMDNFIEANIIVGNTSFSVKELKTLEPEDIILLDHSNIQMMWIMYKDYKNQFRITPNPGLIILIDNDSGGVEMSENITSENLWDSLQVEISAEFDKVKIALGELKNIEEGLVVDVSSLYNNNITLKVDEKVIATGELVIINDRYGVKIEKIYGKTHSEQNSVPQQHSEQVAVEQAQIETFVEQEPVFEQANPANEQDELDYSDFELDDEDI